MGAAAQCALLPRPAPQPTLQQQGPLPLSCHPALPSHRVGKLCKHLVHEGHSIVVVVELKMDQRRLQVHRNFSKQLLPVELVAVMASLLILVQLLSDLLIFFFSENCI